MNGNPPRNFPTVFVIFGATGDLMGKKIVPALFHLFEKRLLPKMFHVIGVARRAMPRAQFQEYVGELLRSHFQDTRIKNPPADFLRLFSYHQGMFEQEDDYARLAQTLGRIDGKWQACSNKLFYLSVPPQFYETIFTHLASSGLTIPCGPGEGWTRVIVEKPFGKDLKTAQKLDELLGRLFKEEQLYRIDHYLAKQMVQNILNFRFSNNLFEHDWNAKLIERMELRFLEDIGVEDRGPFYDGVGALRDVGQNHLLQMLALITMEYPEKLKAQEIRRRRAEILEKLRLPADTATATTYRAQYDGYRKINGVPADTQTETYFKVRAELNTPRFAGIPIILEGGKRLGNAKKEIVITFTHPAPCLCPPGKHFKNRLIFHIAPKEGITIQFWAKKPGLGRELEERTLDFWLRDDHTNTIQYVEAYAKLLLDCILGDQTLFVSTEEVRAMWQFIDPIMRAWKAKRVPLKFYAKNTDSALQESTALVENAARPSTPELRREIGIIGLGKMGAGLARQLNEKGWRVVAFNRTAEVTREIEKEGVTGAYSIAQLVKQLKPPRVVWIMVPNGAPLDEVIFGKGGLVHVLKPEDILIDGGNSYFKDTQMRYQKLKKTGIRFIDAGVSGGPAGARSGACIMAGGPEKLFLELEPLFRDLSVPEGYAHFEGPGAGHFVKMVHNGIEYGMMQALAEGFAVLKKSRYKIDLRRAADIYNHGSVVESRLVGWLSRAYQEHGVGLNNLSGTVASTGEGEWTVRTAKALKIPTPVIEDAFEFRLASARTPSYIGKILTALRNQFGGHSTK